MIDTGKTLAFPPLPSTNIAAVQASAERRGAIACRCAPKASDDDLAAADSPNWRTAVPEVVKFASIAALLAGPIEPHQIMIGCGRE